MRKGQKMSDEMRKKRSEYMKANPLRHWLGKKREDYSLSEDGRRRIVEALKRRAISPKVIAHTSSLNKGKTGSNHPKWTENKKRPFYQSVRTLFQYRQWRTTIFERDNYTCQFCKIRGGDLEADHNPKRFVDILRSNAVDTIEKAINCKELWSAEGRTLCGPCHETTFRFK